MSKINFIFKLRAIKTKSYLEAHRSLSKKNNLSLIQKIKQKLSDSLEYDENGNDFLSCYNQYLITYVLNQGFTKALLLSLVHRNRRFKYPIPKNWRIILEKNGFKADTIQNHLRWHLYSLKYYFVGLATFFLEVIKSIFLKKNVIGSYVYFSQLSKENLPKSPLRYHNNGIVSWFIDIYNNKGVTIMHSIKGAKEEITYNASKINYIESPIPNISGIFNWIKLFFWVIKYSVSALLNQQKAILFRQSVFHYFFLISPKGQLAKKYLFNNSSTIFRPLWTYAAEQKGASIIYYFYSLNNHIILEKNNEKQIYDYNWPHSTWSQFWFWNQHQLDLFNSIIKSKFHSKLVGITPFYNSKKLDLKKLKNKTILVFDIQPKPEYQYVLYGANFDYYNTKSSISFLETLDKISKKLSFDIIFKSKRKVPTKYINNQYFNYTNKLFSQDNWIEIDPENGVNELCKLDNIIASIATPFTSTTYITLKNNIPTVYFDVSKKVSYNQFLNRSIDIISSEIQLLNWLNKLINE